MDDRHDAQALTGGIQWHQRWFADYAAAKTAEAGADAAPLRLKTEHTRRVLANAWELVTAEGFPPRLARAALLAALYHDVGRFEQYLRHRTFNDRDSGNHGILGARVLRHEGCLQGEVDKNMIGAAVALHNRFALPRRLPADLRRITLVVRDADKLDIVRLMDEQLNSRADCASTVVFGLPDDPNLASARVIEAALAGRVASYADLRSVGDFRLLLATWVFDMNFATSRRRFIVDGHARRLVAALPDDSPQAPARAALLARFEALFLEQSDVHSHDVE
ncbi:MAG: HD domain-containing protein [Desulfobulbaceae bacterium]|nr:HD domain-containing protein [Desulfobulbaceae bacterium]